MKGFSAFNRFLFILNIFPAALLGLTCYIAYFPIPGLALFDVLGLLVPVLVVANIPFLIYWLLLRKWQWILSFLFLLLGYWCFGSVYKWHSPTNKEESGSISVLTYNVKQLNYNKYTHNREVSVDIIEFIEEADPDIVCFQEIPRFKTLKLELYPYMYQPIKGVGKSSQVIFSKFPILSSGSLNFPNTGNNAIFADITYGKDILRVYNIHLESYWIRSFRSLLKRNLGVDFLKRLQYTASKHREQAELLMAHKAKSPYPSIICGDFNQTSYSPTFQKLLSGMRDTFKEKGNGWGTTFIRNIISARIDFILTDAERFEVLEHRNYDLQLSDHLPVMARVRLRSDE